MQNTELKAKKNQTGAKTNLWSSFFEKSSPLFTLLILIGYMSFASPSFFSVSNFVNIIRQSTVVGTMAIGQTLIIILAGIDLSVGAVMAFSGCLIAVASTQWHFHPLLALFLGILAGIAVGLTNGIIITKAKIQDFIATLGSLTAIQGVALLISAGLPISGIPDGLLVVGSERFLGIPISVFIFILITVTGWLILNHTTLGRNTLAIGGNLEAAKVSGIQVNFTKIIIYGFSGLCCAIASLVMIGRLNSANALMGDGLELQSIAAVVLGGTSISGGAGSIGGTIIGVVTMGVLNNGLDLLNISAFWQRVILGLVIIGVVTLDTWRRNRIKNS
ncbi:MAG: ABC transporter permease [Bacteroidota bacterium]